MEVYEGSGTTGVLELPVGRSAGAFGRIGVSWLATSVSASTADFNPQSGNITFQEGQVSHGNVYVWGVGGDLVGTGGYLKSRI